MIIRMTYPSLLTNSCIKNSMKKQDFINYSQLIDRPSFPKKTQIDSKLLEDISWICLKFKVCVANLLVDELCVDYSNKAQMLILIKFH